MDEMPELSENKLKTAFINVFKDWKEKMVMLNEHVENLSREMQIIKQNIMQILELKIKVSEIKMSHDRINSRLEMAKEIVDWTWRQINRNYPIWRTKKKD